MPFIAPIIGASLIGAGATVGSTLLARHKGGTEKAVLAAQAEQAQAQAEAARKGIGFAEEMQPISMRLLRRGQGALGGALDYWRRILSGREGAASALGPEINQILNQFQQARVAGRTLQPRGGGATALTRRIDEEVVPGQIAGLLATARPAAAQQIGALGGDITQLGLGGMGTTSGLLNLGTGAGTGALQYGLGRQGLMMEAGRGLGRNILDIMRLGREGGGGGISSIPGSSFIPQLPIGMGRGLPAQQLPVPPMLNFPARAGQPMIPAYGAP